MFATLASRIFFLVDVQVAENPRYMCGVAVLAEIPLRSPQKLCIFIIKKIVC